MTATQPPPTITPQRLAIAAEASDPVKIDKLMATGNAMCWESTANVLACELQRVHEALNGQPVYDYSAQRWVED